VLFGRGPVLPPRLRRRSALQLEQVAHGERARGQHADVEQVRVAAGHLAPQPGRQHAGRRGQGRLRPAIRRVESPAPVRRASSPSSCRASSLILFIRALHPWPHGDRIPFIHRCQARQRRVESYALAWPAVAGPAHRARRAALDALAVVHEQADVLDLVVVAGVADAGAQAVVAADAAVLAHRQGDRQEAVLDHGAVVVVDLAAEVLGVEQLVIEEPLDLDLVVVVAVVGEPVAQAVAARGPGRADVLREQHGGAGHHGDLALEDHVDVRAPAPVEALRGDRRVQQVLAAVGRHQRAARLHPGRGRGGQHLRAVVAAHLGGDLARHVGQLLFGLSVHCSILSPGLRPGVC
jgi:hypothetical protein